MQRRAKLEGPLTAAAGAAAVSAIIGAGAAMAPLAAAEPRPASLATPGPLPSLLSPSSSPPSGSTSTAPQPTLAPAPAAPPAAGTAPRLAAPRAPAPSSAPDAGGGSESANQTLQKYMTAHDDPTFRLGKGTLFVEHCRTAHCVRSSVTINTGYAGVVTYTFWIDAAPSPTPSK